MKVRKIAAIYGKRRRTGLRSGGAGMPGMPPESLLEQWVRHRREIASIYQVSEVQHRITLAMAVITLVIAVAVILCGTWIILKTGGLL